LEETVHNCRETFAAHTLNKSRYIVLAVVAFKKPIDKHVYNVHVPFQKKKLPRHLGISSLILTIEKEFNYKYNTTYKLCNLFSF